LRNLRSISLCIPAEHAPQSPIPRDASIWCPPSPVTPVIPYSLPTPMSSPVKRGAYNAPRLPEPTTPPMESGPLAVTSITDPALPSQRDIKKLAKKCEKLERLEWYGHDARGTWIIDREPLLRIGFQEPAGPTDELLDRVRWEQAAAAAGWKPDSREGQAWVESEWLMHELGKEKERKLEKEREIERDKQREKEKAERKREQERPKIEVAPPSPVFPVVSLSPAEDPLQSQFPPPSITRLSKQKIVKSQKQSTDTVSSSSSTWNKRGSGSPSNAKRGSGRGRGQTPASGWRGEKPNGEGSTARSRRTSTGGGRGTGRGRGKPNNRGSSVRV